MRTWASRHPELTLDLPRRSEEQSNAASNGWTERIDSLLAIRRLEDDWDGQGSPAPTVEVVDSALILAMLLRQDGAEAPTGVVQGVGGEVLFDWQSAGGRYIEFEISAPYTADVFIQAQSTLMN